MNLDLHLRHANLCAWRLAEWAEEGIYADKVEGCELSEGMAVWEPTRQEETALVYYGETMSNHV